MAIRELTQREINDVSGGGRKFFKKIGHALGKVLKGAGPSVVRFAAGRAFGGK
ncbi:hypothetical protein N0A02_32870 (plasmid) [Paraburkholderia acidicola]|uniref:Bacteriocin n=1 Tax=Paraburkholderia acidicola TaxID=1912599 RepID=A0ABV1M131_9BURK